MALTRQQYDYYLKMYNDYAGDPSTQNQIVSQVYNLADPTNNTSSLTDVLSRVLGTSTSAQPTTSTGGLSSLFQKNTLTPQADTSFGGSDLTGTESQPVETPGNFGFGWGKGELFGEGGALGPTSIPRLLIDPLVGATVTGIINPGAALVSSGLNVANQMSKGKTFEEALGSPEAAIQNQGQLIQDQGQFNEYLQNPLLGGLKSGATIGSYAMPQVGGIANPIARGAASGALSGSLLGFGQSKTGQEGEGIARGGIIGGLAGGALAAAGEGVKAISKAYKNYRASKVAELASNTDLTPVEKLQDYLIDPNTAPVTDKNGIAVMSGNKGQQVGRDLQITGELGVKFDPTEFNYYKDERTTRAVLKDVFDLTGQKTDQYGQQVVKDMLGEARNNLIRNSGWNGTSIDDIIDRAWQYLKQEAPTSKLTRADMAEHLNNYLGDVLNVTNDQELLAKYLGDGKLTIDPETLQNIASATYDVYKRFYKNPNTNSVDTAVVGSLDRAMRRIMGDNIVGYTRANDLYRRLYGQVRNMASAGAAQQEVSQIGKMSLTQKASQLAVGQAGRTIEALSDPGTYSRLLGAPINAAGGVANIAANPFVQSLGQYAAPRIAVSGVMNNTSNVQPQVQGISTSSGSQPTTGSGSITGSLFNNQSDTLQKVALIAALTDAGYGSVASTLANTLYPDNTSKISDTQRKSITSLELADSALAEFENTLANLGQYDSDLLAKTLGRGRETAATVGLDPNLSYYNDLRRAMAAQIARALGESGTLNEGDIQRALAAIPSITDSKDVAAKKLAFIRGQLLKAQKLVVQGGSTMSSDISSLLANAGL